MNNELLTVLEYIEQERGINREVLIEAIESALMTASRKSIHPANDLTVKVDAETGDIQAWAKLEVVDECIPTADQIILARVREKMPDANAGDIIKWEVTPRNFGRIAAQTAKQAIMQQLRKAEKTIVKEEFEDRIGEILNGTVRRFESGNIIIDFQKAEGILSQKEKIPGEQYMAGDRINALLYKVDISTSGPSLVMSRTHPNFVKKLFEREISEISDGIVEIMGVAREPGGRSKIAVKSNDSRVDPIGACVGMRGIRVKNITAELGGERVDIIRYDEDIKVYAINSLQPAKPKGIEIADDGTITVYVNSEQSRLAYGKRGQNIRLSSRLLCKTMNIIVEEEEVKDSFKEQMQKVIDNLSEALSISSSVAEKLVDGGFLTVDGLSEVELTDLTSIDGINEDDAQQILNAIES